MRHPSEGPPTGTITFLFTDIEGSTQLVRRFGDSWPALLDRHRELVRGALAEHGWEVGTEGDSFFFTFDRAADAATGAAAAQRALESADWPPDGRIRVRMGLHTGMGTLSGSDYVGLDVHRAARIAAAGHGGQIVLSGSTTALVEHDLPPELRIVDLGEHLLKDLPQPEHLYQLVVEGLPSAFPGLRSLVGRAHNLPVALSSLMGREQEVADVRALLASARLVTVTGPGGTGKTRLVQEVAQREAADRAGGVTFVPLEALRDADLIPVEILRARSDATRRPRRPREIESSRHCPSVRRSSCSTTSSSWLGRAPSCGTS